ncbi:MAG: hypothetical protein J6B02_00220 [Selenomonadales bacterium]|nr:hypothetical protein [Selenomonadales bacterium]
MNDKVKEVVQGIHEAMLRKASRDNMTREDIVIENRIFAAMCHGNDVSPWRVTAILNDKYGYELSGEKIVDILRERRLTHQTERKELFRWADNTATLFYAAMQGDKEQFEKFEHAFRNPPSRGSRKHRSSERILIVMIYEKYAELNVYDDKELLVKLGDTLAKYFFYDCCDVIRAVYGLSMHKSGKKSPVKTVEKKLSHEQALMRVEQLENILERTNTMLQDLQDEFEEQLEASKVKELADFFAKLNSEKYGCILDELLVVRKGIDELRKKNYELPIEINGLLIMVKKLIQFVRDSHIEPVMRVNTSIEVVASDVEFCNYEGTPFITPDEKKTVKVISPGWIYKDKELQISRPKVKEEF